MHVDDHKLCHLQNLIKAELKLVSRIETQMSQGGKGCSGPRPVVDPPGIHGIGLPPIKL